MIYTYDILLNWTEKLRLKEFFEWQIEDDLEHIKKIPIIRVDDNFIKDLLTSKLKIDKSFLMKLKNKTESYFHNDIDIIEYAAIFTNGKKTLAIEFSEDGTTAYKSTMLLDEEEEVLEIGEELQVITINYQVLKRNNVNNYLTRKEEEEKEFLIKEIKKIKDKKEEAKLNYLYKEFFNNEEESFDSKLNTIRKEIDKNHHIFNNKLFNLLKLTTIRKK